MRYELQHPNDPSVSAAYGFDPFLHFWVEVRRSGHQVASYDALDAPGERSSVAGVLRVLIGQKFFSDDELWEAKQLSQHFEDASELEKASEGVMIALTVLLNLRLAASRG